jgi:hypothetical protein
MDIKIKGRKVLVNNIHMFTIHGCRYRSNGGQVHADYSLSDNQGNQFALGYSYFADIKKYTQQHIEEYFSNNTGNSCKLQTPLFT